MKGRVGLVVGLVIGVVAGGVAYATIPGSSGVISGCYKKTGGELRVIDPSKGQTCTSKELPLPWSQQGPTGPTGTQGATGPTGPTQTLDVIEVENQINFSAGGLQQVDATCPAGYTVVGGGAAANNQNVNLIDSSPSPLADRSWNVVYYLGQPSIIIARAICLKLS